MSTWSRNRWIEDAKTRVLENTMRTDEAARELIFLYDEAAFQVEQEINALFARYARDNQLTEAEAARLLSDKEYSTWRKSIEEYMAEAAGAAKDSKAMLELNTLAMKSRISRKERLLANIYQNMIALAGDSETKLTDLLGDMLKVNYYESCFSVQRGMGLGFQVAKLDEKLIRQVLEHPWAERTFSEAVWGACDHLSALVKREITLGFIQGSGVDKMAKAIDDVMDKGRYNAERLVRTECKYFANQGELMAYKENGIQRYRFIGGTEGGSCICGELNGHVFPVEDAVAGVNFPPIHPNCLCIVVADFDKSMFNREIKAEPLEENVKFQAWKKKYVDGTGKNDTISLSDSEQSALLQYISSDSYKINDKLRRGAALSKADLEMMDGLDTALKKLPIYPGTVYRSISDMGIDDVDAFIKGHTPGNMIIYHAYTSTSTGVYDASFPIQFVIQSRTGRDIRTYNASEGEILFGRDTVFKVKKVIGNTIYMEEIE